MLPILWINRPNSGVDPETVQWHGCSPLSEHTAGAVAGDVFRSAKKVRFHHTSLPLCAQRSIPSPFLFSLSFPLPFPNSVPAAVTVTVPTVQRVRKLLFCSSWAARGLGSAQDSNSSSDKQAVKNRQVAPPCLPHLLPPTWMFPTHVGAGMARGNVPAHCCCHCLRLS